MRVLVIISVLIPSFAPFIVGVASAPAPVAVCAGANDALLQELLGLQPGIAVVEVGLKVGERLVQLAVDPDEDRLRMKLLELINAHIGAVRAQASEDVEEGRLYRTLVGHFHCFAFRGAVFSNAPLVLLHGRSATHTVELLKQLSIPDKDLAPTLIVSAEHTSKHHEVTSRTERLRHVSR